MAMASPRRIISAASPIALALVAQAETVAKFGPFAPVCIETKPAAMSVMNIVMKNGLTRSGATIKEHLELVVAGGQAADARADDDADVVGVLLGDLKLGIRQRLFASRPSRNGRSGRCGAPLCDPCTARIEILDLGGDTRFLVAGIEVR